MREIERIVEDLKDRFLEKRVLEIACGNADFSLAVSKHANSVFGIDVSLARVARRNSDEIPDNVRFQEMNATQLYFETGSFDAVVSYNAMGHLVDVLEDCISEMIRVLKKGGCLVFIATWKMDRKLIPDIKDLITRTHKIRNSVEIVNKTYYALIWKKI